MKYNWPAVVAFCRQLMLANTQISGSTSEESAELMWYYKSTMLQTDTFHPYNSDHVMDKALKDMPNYCNYRNCDALRHYKFCRDELLNALYEVLSDMQELTQEWFDDKWNHSPGYVKPTCIKFGNWDKVVDVSFAKLIKAAKKGNV